MHLHIENRLRAGVAAFGACVGAALLAVVVALSAMTTALLLLGALGVDSAPATVASAGQDAVVALYAVQLVGLSFFNQTAELRFAAVPGLLLVGLSLVAVTALAARATAGSTSRRLKIAAATSIPYALLVGVASLVVPLHFTAPGFAVGVAVSPSPAEAFLLPLGWGMLFASIGGLIGVYGRGWRREGARLLGAWATPLAASSRVLAAGLAASAAIALIAAFATSGWDLGSVLDGDLGHALKAAGVVLLTLPTLAAAVLVSGFGVPFDWQVDALAHGQGSISAFGGTMPSAGPLAQDAPGVLALAPLIALATVFAAGWLSARRSGPNVKIAFGNAARAALLTTLAVWLLALLARVDAQAGGLLGFHLVPDTGALLWRVPLLALAGSFAGSFAYALTRGPAARRRLAAALLAALRPSGWGWRPGWPGWVSSGLTWRAGLGVSFVAVPVLLVGMGATGPASSAAPESVSLAPIRQAAEQRLERASTGEESVAVTVNPETRVVGTASVHTPLRALGIAPGKSRSAKAEDVLDRYGELFGLSDPATELRRAQSSTDRFGVTHVAFTQTANGLPVFGGGIGVHLSRQGELLDFISGSLIPDVFVADGRAKLTREQAVGIARKMLPSANLAEPSNLRVYAGLPPYVSGPNARLAWFVWLISETKGVSEEYVVDAVTGEVLDTIPKADLVKFRKVHDWNGGSELPGKLVREEEDPPTEDADVDAAYDNTGIVYDFYTGYERDSYDGNGTALVSTVHFAQASGAPFENAYWNGEQLVFGDGFAEALDIVGHEVTHGVIETSTGMVGTGEAGVLSEGFADIMGVTIEMNHTGKTDWRVGENLPGSTVRDLSDPNTQSELEGAGIPDPNPAHLSEWVETCLDNFGVHINSTILGHAFYLAVTSLGEAELLELEEVAYLFYRGWTEYLKGVPTPTLEDARAAVLEAATEIFTGQEILPVVHKAIEDAFDEVGLDGVANPPAPKECPGVCSFAMALYGQKGVSTASAVEMLSTLYKARGELAQTSVAGDHFMPLYEANMVRINELVSQDPVLAEMTVAGLEEITPALEGLIEGEGGEFELTAAQMAKIEAALERLAEDDRLYGGEAAGELADLIEGELQWLGLPSYGGMSYESGFNRLNSETESQMLMEETGEYMEPSCNDAPYPNNFHINGFNADTPEHRIPGQVSRLTAAGTICGTVVEKTEGTSGCVGEGSLNTKVTVQLPPGDKVNSSKNLPSKSWVGKTTGRAILCAGDETQTIYGEAGLVSLQSWSESQCPATVIACYEARTEFEGEIGTGYVWISEKEGALTLTSRPVTVETENEYFVKVGFGRFNLDLCARAGNAETTSCGGPTATWIHQNGEGGGLGCPGGKGRYYMQAENAAEQTTVPVSWCVRWEEEAQMQTIDAPNSLNAVSCVPATTTCIAANSKGNALYSTNVSATAASTWNSWSGPGSSPAHDIACPSSALCVLSVGEVSGGGGNVYRATSLGGSFASSFNPANGAGAFSCPSSSFCVSAHEGGGFIRYSTKPSGILWTAVVIGTGAMKDVACLSPSFCAVVDGSGNVRVATTEKRVKEASGWTATKVNGEAAIAAVACSSTTSCIAVDGSSELLNLAIASPSGSATASSQVLPEAGALNDVACSGETCVVVDDEGAIFSSSNSGTTWAKRFDARGDLKAVSCASAALCAAVTSAGDVVKFDPV